MANKKLKILVFGKSGLLGGEFFNFFLLKKFDVSGYNSSTCDISDFNQVVEVVKKNKPDIVINCAAKIGIDDCENNALGAYMINAIGPGNIARALKILNKKSVFLHISTSYIFGSKGLGGYKEDSDPKLTNVYGWSKFLGEKILEQELGRDSLVKYFIIRTGWLYGGFRRTFIEDIADSLLAGKTIKLVSDNYNVPTWTRDFVHASYKILKDRKAESGIYHIFNSYGKPVAKYDIGIYMAEILGMNPGMILKCRYKDIFKFGRLANSNLLNSKLPDLPDWKKSLKNYLKLYSGKVNSR